MNYLKTLLQQLLTEKLQVVSLPSLGEDPIDEKTPALFSEML
jgi:hypothetical protein